MGRQGIGRGGGVGGGRKECGKVRTVTLGKIQTERKSGEPRERARL